MTASLATKNELLTILYGAFTPPPVVKTRKNLLMRKKPLEPKIKYAPPPSAESVLRTFIVGVRWWSVLDLSDTLQIEAATVAKALKSLENKGELEVSPSRRNGYPIKVYRITQNGHE